MLYKNPDPLSTNDDKPADFYMTTRAWHASYTHYMLYVGVWGPKLLQGHDKLYIHGLLFSNHDHSDCRLYTWGLTKQIVFGVTTWKTSGMYAQDLFLLFFKYN